ncbi:MAG: assimilatory sulfite reductase (NADPH) flavoprotein subunit [Methylobacter sp.]
MQTPERKQTPLSDDQHRLLQQLLAVLSPEQASWVGGYLSGLVAAPVAGGDEQAEITILVGSQTGNSEALAEQTHRLATELGLKTAVRKMGDYKLPQLKSEQKLLVIVSTYGDGEPPDNAKEFVEYLLGKRAPPLPQLHYAVLGLGDSSYEFFCKTAADVDRRLAELGAARIYPRVDCDVDYEEQAEAWMQAVLTELSRHAALTPKILAPQPSIGSVYSRKHPFPAVLLDNIVLNGRGSDKETRHLELSLEGSGLVYEPGDALGVYPTNAPEAVEALLQTLHFDGSETVCRDGEDDTFYDALFRHYEITTLTRPVLQKYAAVAANRDLERLLADPQRLTDYLHGRELVDLIGDFPAAHLTPQVFVDCLRKLPPRLYSIASSLKRHPDEAHITVAVVRYQTYGRQRKGVASTFLAQRVAEGEAVPVYIDRNSNFKLPADSSLPIVMIGPGTGIAPFRAFIEEREAVGASGKNWLFFGDRHFETDFLYQAEWLNYLKSGILTKMNVAFSRDRPQKRYVQHELMEHGRELYDWLQQGAYLYVCGDGQRMAHDVHRALLDIVGAEIGEGNAEDYVAALQKEKRYQRDVY